MSRQVFRARSPPAADGCLGGPSQSACVGADTRRVVWIDVFAVRQWPGNGADLDFRGVLEGCVAAVVVAAPVEGTLTQNGVFQSSRDGGVHKAAVQKFRERDEYKAAAKVLPFCRLWCVVEIAAVLDMRKILAVLDMQKALVFSSCRVVGGGAGATHVAVERGQGAGNMLLNCSHLVDVEAADAAVEADKVRELGRIGEENFGRINQAVATALYAAAVSVCSNVPEVDAAR